MAVPPPSPSSFMRLAYSASNFPPPVGPPPLLGPGAWPRGVRQSVVREECKRRGSQRQRKAEEEEEEVERKKRRRDEPRAMCPTELRSTERKGQHVSTRMRADDLEFMLTRSCGLKGRENKRGGQLVSRRKTKRERDEQVIPAEKFRCSGQSHFCTKKKDVSSDQYRAR